MTPAAPLRGCIPILATPFSDTGALDLSGIDRQIEWVLDTGAAGIACNAIASEGYKLTEAERDAVVERCVAAVAGRVPVVAAADAAGVEPAIDRARRAADRGAAALMVLPPSFIKPGSDDLLDYYQRVAASGGIPLIVQDAPQLTGVPMGPDLWLRMAERIPEMGYVKVEGTPQGPTISDTLRLAGDRLGMFCGWGGLSILDALERGAVGSMPAANFTPEFARIQAAWEANDRERAEQLFARAIPFMLWTMQSVDFSVATMKEEFYQRQIISSNHQRRPAGRLDNVAVAQLRRFLDHRLQES